MIAAARRGAPATLSFGALLALAAGAVLQHPTAALPAVIVLLGCAALVARPVVRWNGALTALLVVILFIPIRRYTIPVKLAFQLDPYRVIVFALVVVWALSLLSDRRVRTHRSGLEGPIGLIAFATLASVGANGGRVTELQTEVLKAVTFFASFLCVFYLVVSVIRTIPEIERLLRVLVGGGAVIALLAIIESRTGLNPFNHLRTVLPFLEQRSGTGLARGAQLRAFGPAEHPIALSAALVLLVPPALHLGLAERRKIWWLALGALVLGALATISRTGLIMLAVELLVFLRLRPTETKRMWPLAIVLLVATHFAMPGTLGTFRAALFPQGGLVKQQQSSKGSCSSGGRLTDLGPSFAAAAQKPLFGYGYGTRIVDGPRPNSCILDDQWLGTLLENGAVAVFGWLWVFRRIGRRLGRGAREDDSDRGWLLVALCASLTACSVGMLTFDAFSFIQVNFLIFILLAFASIALAAQPPRSPRAVPQPDGQ